MQIQSPRLPSIADRPADPRPAGERLPHAILDRLRHEAIAFCFASSGAPTADDLSNSIDVAQQGLDQVAARWIADVRRATGIPAADVFRLLDRASQVLGLMDQEIARAYIHADQYFDTRTAAAVLAKDLDGVRRRIHDGPVLALLKLRTRLEQLSQLVEHLDADTPTMRRTAA